MLSTHSWSKVTSSDTLEAYGFSFALSSSETLFLPVRNCKQLLNRSLHGLPYKNCCLHYLLSLPSTFLHLVVASARCLSVTKGFLLRELPTTQTPFRVFNYHFSWAVAMFIQILIHQVKLSILSDGKMVLIFVVCKRFTPTLAVLSTKLTYFNRKYTNATKI